MGWGRKLDFVFFRENSAKFFKKQSLYPQFFLSTEVSDSLLKSNDAKPA